MLTMLSAFAQLERSFILARTHDGRMRAKAQGRKFGPKFKLNAQQTAPAGDLQREGRALREIGGLLAAMPQQFRAHYKPNNKRREIA